MKKFSELGIKLESQGFIGEKIRIDKVQNRQISIHDFKIRDSKFKDKGNGKCLYMQIEIDGIKRVLFTGSGALMELIEKIDKADFPFTATIIKENDRFEFS